MLEKRIGIFIYYEWLSIAPSILSVIRVLTENSYFVDVFHLHDESLGKFKPESEKVTSITVNSGKLKIITLLKFFIISLKRIIKKDYKFFIGTDQEAIMISGILSKIKKVPNVYYSLEILTKEDISKEKGLRKILLLIRRLLENYFSKRAESTIIQDKYRAEVLIQDMGIKKERIFLIPNSYDFDPEKIKNIPDLDFPIPKDKKVIIYAGSIIPEMAIEELVNSIKFWPENTILILHTPYKTPYLEEIIKLIKNNNLEERVIVSVRKLSFEELFSLLKEAHIGISLYRFTNKSFELATSGKLNFYLVQGLPFISSRIPYVEDLIFKYNCGICVDKPKEIGEAVKKILDNYSEYSKNTKKCYEEELEFSKHFKKFLEHYEKK